MLGVERRSESSRPRGFTIVELLIVIVVIGILVALVISTFSNAQARARDAQRKSDLAQIAKAFHLFNNDNGHYLGVGSGCGHNGDGNGWYHYDYDGATTTLRSMSQCLLDGKYISSNMVDPLNSKGCTVVPNTTPAENDCFHYMKYECGNSSYLYANLETMPHSTTDTDSACNTVLDSYYGMNYYVKLR